MEQTCTKKMEQKMAHQVFDPKISQAVAEALPPGNSSVPDMVAAAADAAEGATNSDRCEDL